MSKKKKSAAKPKSALKPASTSSDPAVHQLLAEHQTATMNRDIRRAQEIVKQIAELGFSS